MLTPSILAGISAPLLTPFHSDGSVNYEEYARLTRFVTEKGIHGVFVCGTTGEFVNLTLEERKNLLTAAVEGAVPGTSILFNTTAMNLRDMKELFDWARDNGAIGVCMILLSLALLAVTLVKHHRGDDGGTAARERSPEERKAALRDELRAIALAAIILLYSALFATLGYFVSTLAASTAILLLFRVRKIWAYPVVYAVAVAVWAAFTFLLSVRLP